MPFCGALLMRMWWLASRSQIKKDFLLKLLVILLSQILYDFFSNDLDRRRVPA
jgi:uncharacterized protein (UPF0333 family)